LGIKTLTSLATGVLVAIMLTAMGVDFAILWGLLAFLLNYIPNIGSFLAAIPAVLLALLTDGLTAALVVTVGYVLINGIIGNVVEPRIMGEGLGLSTVVVFLSLILWGWLLGAVGMLLSVPITTTLKIVLETNESTRPLALLLSSGKAQVVAGPLENK
jgi:predicted PurR-regulated permease PerM